MINSLTSLRFIAALFVFLLHARFQGIFKEGHVGVGFFFILSGFILTFVYFKTLDPANSWYLKKFYIARFARIYPVHLLTFLIYAPLVFGRLLIKKNLSFHDALVMGSSSITLVQSFIPVQWIYYSWNGVSWSLSDEIFFYLVFPLILWVIQKKLDRLPGWLLIVTLMLIWSFGMSVTWIAKDNPLAEWKFYIFPVSRLFDFLSGCIIGVIFLRHRNQNLVIDFRFTCLEAIAILVLSCAFYFSAQVHQSLRFSLYYMPFLALVIYIFAFEKGHLSKLLAWSPFVFLGEISFSFYMLHGPVMHYVMVTAFSSNPQTRILSAIISFIITLCLSIIIYKYYEIPMRDKIKGIAKMTTTSNSLEIIETIYITK